MKDLERIDPRHVYYTATAEGYDGEVSSHSLHASIYGLAGMIGFIGKRREHDEQAWVDIKVGEFEGRPLRKYRVKIAPHEVGVIFIDWVKVVKVEFDKYYESHGLVKSSFIDEDTGEEVVTYSKGCEHDKCFSYYKLLENV